MGEVELLHIGHKALGQFAPIVKARYFTQVIQLALPGAWMQFIDRQRRTVGMALGAVFHPLVVLPGMAEFAGHLRCGAGRQLSGAGQRVGLQRQHALLAQHLEFVGFAYAQARHEQLPHPGTVP
ncbi:hypothetical protein D3C81_1666060 [compost metagenome]